MPERPLICPPPSLSLSLIHALVLNGHLEKHGNHLYLSLLSFTSSRVLQILMDRVRGVLLDESFLFAENEQGDFNYLQGAEQLLRRLQHSKLRVVISYNECVLSQKVSTLKKMAAIYSFDCVVLNASHIDDQLSEILFAGSAVGESCVYVTAKNDEGLFFKLRNQSWRVIVKTAESGATEIPGLLFISKLQELPVTLLRISKMALDKSVVTVGYIMKPSREEDFAKRGAFPMLPTKNGLMFVPLTFDLPLASQIQEVDVLLHKATDEIISIDPSNSLDFSKGVSYSKGMQEIERYIQDHPDCCVIDPIKNIYPLLDRHMIQQILLGLEDLNAGHQYRIRGPHFLKVDDFREPYLGERLSQAKLSFPTIVKPQVACGVSDAHSMAIVFRTDDFIDLCVPVPAILQEYIDHASVLFKFYVLGENVFHAVKKSTPNAKILLSSSEKSGLRPIIFDSLKSLPVANEDQLLEPCLYLKGNENYLDVGLVTTAANWLRRKLGLTIFGFDVVIQEGSGDHVIVDVNYLPSFKEIPNDDAVPAFWEAIKSSYESRKAG